MARRQEVGRRIAAAMRQSDTTQKALGEAIGRSQTQIGRYIKGENLPEWEIVGPLARELQISAVDLMWPFLDTGGPAPTDVEMSIHATPTLDADAKASLLTFYRAVRRAK